MSTVFMQNPLSQTGRYMPAASIDIRGLLPALYAVAVLWMVAPMLEIMRATWPLRPASLAWRFGTTGMFFNNMPFLILGIVLCMVVAGLMNQRRVLRAFAWLNAALVLILLVLAGAFILDALQLRPALRPDLKPGFDLAALKALLFVAFSLLATCSLFVGGWRATRRAHA